MTDGFPRHRQYARTELAAYLEQARIDQGWTLPALAHKTGYHCNTVARVLHGDNVRLQTLIDVAQALGIQLTWMGLTTTACVSNLNKTA